MRTLTWISSFVIAYALGQKLMRRLNAEPLFVPESHVLQKSQTRPQHGYKVSESSRMHSTDTPIQDGDMVSNDARVTVDRKSRNSELLH